MNFLALLRCFYRKYHLATSNNDGVFRASETIWFLSTFRKCHEYKDMESGTVAMCACSRSWNSSNFSNISWYFSGRHVSPPPLSPPLLSFLCHLLERFVCGMQSRIPLWNEKCGSFSAGKMRTLTGISNFVDRADCLLSFLRVVNELLTIITHPNERCFVHSRQQHCKDNCFMPNLPYAPSPCALHLRGVAS